MPTAYNRMSPVARFRTTEKQGRVASRCAIRLCAADSNPAVRLVVNLAETTVQINRCGDIQLLELDSVLPETLVVCYWQVRNLSA
jgi:hypothetical protein